MVFSIHPAAAPLIALALIAGILILVVPRVLIAIYLVLIGLLGLMDGHF